MKNLTKFFVAVAALFVGVSCATDATEDLTQQIAGNGQTVITVSTGDTKTSLGEKDGDTYPVYWSEGDKIALNGVASAALAAEFVGKTAAEFKWEQEYELPYLLTYPAGANGVITFDSSQAYAAGTFAVNTAPMYAYVTAEGAVNLQHLAGVLRLGVYAQEETVIRSMYIENLGDAPIAGDFTCSIDGVLTPTENVTTKITYSVGNVVLSQEPTLFHIVVPAGEYEALRLTIITDKGIMVAKVKAGEGKEVAAGVVREFGNVEFSSKGGTCFEVKDEPTLAGFAAAVTDGSIKAYDIVRVTANVDMTDKTWTPIEGFTGILDGGNHTISGLTQPLFGELNGIVTNLTVDVTIATTTNGDKVGALAKRIGVCKLVNCTAKGSINFASTGTSAPHVGGLFGSTLGTAHVEVIGCNNYCNLSITGDTKCNIYIGGLTGYVSDATFSDCHNYGSVTFDSKAVASTAKYLYMGGLIGSNQGTDITMTGCSNNGTVTTTSKTTNKVNVLIGGIIGHTKRVIIGKNLTNNGAINLQSSAPRYWCGGVIGWFDKDSPCDLSYLDNCRNTGAITLAKAGSGVCYIGGCLGAVESNVSGIIKNFHNSGDLNLNEGQTSRRSRRMFVGGVAGYVAMKTKFQYCSNTGDVIAPYYLYMTTKEEEIVNPETGETEKVKVEVWDVGTFIGLLLGNRYYHTGSGGTSSPMISTAKNCYINGTINRYKIDKSGNDEVEVDTDEEMYKYAFAELESYEGDTDPTKFFTNCSATDATVAQVPAQE